MSNILIDDGLKNEIKTRADIVQVISQYVALQKDGALYKGLCPFHKEDTPSFSVMPVGHKDNQYGTFYCYGCHAGNKEETNIGNDVIAFVMAIEEVEFMDACQMLCDMFGIPYQLRQQDPELNRLRKEMTDRNIQYYNYLSRNVLAMNYIQSRGINKDSITKFRMGLVPPDERVEWRRNRLVFGITDVNYKPEKANTIAMGYRCLMGAVEAPDKLEYFPNCKENAKYINDAESKIFKKSKVLFGLNHATKAIRKMGFAIVVEGYMDVIIMHQSGFSNTVAPMGTSFTNEQMDLIKRYTNQLMFFMDADERGLESMRRVLPRLLEKGFSVLVVEAPKGLDPADLANSLGQDKGKVSSYIKNHSTPALQWCTNTALLQYESKVHKAKIEALRVVLPILDKVSHRESKIAYLSAIADKLDVDASLLVKQEEVVNNDVKLKPADNVANNANPLNSQTLPHWAKN